MFTTIRHPLSFWLSFIIALTTALLSVALHGIGFILAVLNVAVILALPYIARKEARWVDHG